MARPLILELAFSPWSPGSSPLTSLLCIFYRSRETAFPGFAFQKLDSPEPHVAVDQINI